MADTASHQAQEMRRRTRMRDTFASGGPKSPVDGRVTGFGLIERRCVAAIANDLNVMGAFSAPVINP